MADFLTQPGPTTKTTEWECQCARCGSSMDFQHCSECGGDGETWVAEYGPDVDPEWYTCENCKGRGGWDRCLSSLGWCEGNSLSGREDVEVRWTAEWFEITVWVAP